MRIENILFGFDDSMELSELSIIPDKKMLFIENNVTGSRFKLDSKFIRRDEPVKLQELKYDYIDGCSIHSYDLKLRGSVVINRCTYNPFLLRSQQREESVLVHVTLNTEKFTLLKYDTDYEVISTLKNKKRGIVSATLCGPAFESAKGAHDIMKMYCLNKETNQYVRIIIGVWRPEEGGFIRIETTAELDKEELKYCRNNTRYHHGRSLTFKHKANVTPKYLVSTNVPAKRYQDPERVYIEIDKPGSEFEVDKETNIRWDLVSAIKKGFESTDNVKALALSSDLELTFEEIYELKLSYVFVETESGDKCIKSN